MEKKKENKQEFTIDRREFIVGATAGSLSGISALLGGCSPTLRPSVTDFPIGNDYTLLDPENIMYSTCLQCNTGCGIKVKFHDGVAVKIEGNPLAPHAMYPHLPYDSSPFEIADIDGSICPRGQAGLQSVYDPYRLIKVLKRAGKRGENKWESIDFKQAIKEIVQGGNIFSNVAGEENRNIAGLKAIRAVTDPKIGEKLEKEVKALTKELKKLRKEKKEQEIKTLISNFKENNADYLQYLIDPDHPDLGLKNNQLVFNWGRVKAGRGDFIKRFTTDAMGSVNAHGHTTVCQGSLYFTGKAMSEQWAYDEKSHEVKWTGGDKFYWQADTGNSKFIIFVGASPFEGNYGPPGRSVRIMDSVSKGKMKYVVIDPRFSKTASRAWKWLPCKPGMESAIAFALIRWLIENEKYNIKYLSNANKSAAKQDGETTWCNASWLVKIDEKGRPEKFLRSHEIGLGGPEKRTNEKGEEYEYELFVCVSDGSPKALDPNSTENPVEGSLFINTTLSGIRVKSAMQLLKESAFEYTLEEWAELCGVKASDLIEIAEEFAKHGNKSVADIHRGVSQHTNGYYNVLAWYSLNLLVGNYDHKGGSCKASAYNVTGDKSGKPIENMPFIFKDLSPGKLKTFGISIIRHDTKYEDTTLFEGYPAKRPWYPLASDIYQEIIPSIGDSYPYPIKALFLYMGSPVYSLPGGQALIEILSDVNRLPLFVASDIVIGETTMYADYIFPDLTYLERWEFQGSHPSFAPKIQPIRSPLIPPIPEEVEVFGEKMPISLESMILAIAEQMDLPCFGPNGFGKNKPFTRPEDFYLKMVANVAVGEKPGEEVPDASDEELALFTRSRKHLPPSVFDESKWKQAVGEDWWRKTVYVLNRGGRYQDYEKIYDNDMLKNKYGKQINMYCEKTAGVKNSRTGEKFSGVAKHYDPYVDSLGNSLQYEEKDYPFKLLTYREISQTKSRTSSNYWLLALLPENYILINKKDADNLLLKDGDQVKIVSASNPDGYWDLGNGNKKPMIGILKTIQGIRPGTISFALGFGHWAYGSEDVIIDGKVIKKDERRGKGIHANAAMRLDPTLNNTPLSDPVGASVSFYDTNVKIVKA